MKVLVVDDDEGVCETMVAMLRKLGHDTTVAGSADDAMEAIEDVDVVLSDYNLPRMSGLEFLQQVRVKWPCIGAAIVSGIGPRADWQAVADVWLMKPLLLTEIETGIRVAFEAGQARQIS